MPHRLQRKRTSGWRKPEGAIYVGRRTQWGNPWVEGKWPKQERATHRARLVEMYRMWLLGTHPDQRMLPDIPDLTPLKGKDLLCWCDPNDGMACHADILLELANKELEDG